jgi:hypothetical protein
MSEWSMDTPFAWYTLWAAIGANFFCRACGALFSGRVQAQGEFFKWVTAVTYALMAGLTVRLLVLPSGILGQVPLWVRLLSGAAAMAVMLTKPATRLVPSLAAGCVITLAYGVWRHGWA